MITTEIKKTIIADFQTKSGDTGSPEVQIALMNSRINDLNIHFSSHKKDHLSRRGLLRLVSQRKKMLDYLKSKNLERYRELIKRLGLRK